MTDTNTKPAPKFKTVSDLLDEPDIDIPFLWNDTFPKGTIVGIVGKSGVNKSTFCRQLCLSVATKQPTFCGLQLTPTYGRALYCYSEEGETWLRRYIRKNVNGMVYENELLQNMKVLNMEEFESGADLLDYIREELTRQSYDLIVFDSYSDFISKFGAKLNDNDTIRSVKSDISFLNADGCTVVLNHHTSDKSISVGTFLGATAFKQIVRAQLEIFENGNERIISCEKNSYAVKFEPMIFELSDDFLFIPTGRSMTRAELVELVSAANYTPNRPAQRPKIVPCDADAVSNVFGKSDTLMTAQIVQKLVLLYAISERTANDWIKDVCYAGTVEKVKHGVYKMKVQNENAISNYIDTAICNLHFDESEGAEYMSGEL